MQRNAGRHMQKSEEILAGALRGFATELRMFDVVDLVANIHHERHCHLEDFINSAAELFFKPGTLKFSHAGDVELQWDRPATVIIQMEFCHMHVSAHFKLRIEAEGAGVQLELLRSTTGEIDDDTLTQRLAAAVADGRLLLPSHAIISYQRDVLRADVTG